MSSAGSAILGRKAGSPSRPAIDLEHLDRVTLGQEDLKRQVLALFVRQANEQVAGIRAAATLEARSVAAHTLVGSARGVGAFSVAYVASEIERSRGPIEGRLKALERATEAARAFITNYLAH